MSLDFRKAALWLLVFGAILRVALAVVNGEANDDHISVIRTIAYENRFPEKEEISEAFQPRLYYVTVAALLKFAPQNVRRLHVRIAQLISCLAGILTLVLAYRFLMTELQVSEKARFLAFSLMALNPALIGINGQATNDSFVILFSSLAFYFGWHFFQSWRTDHFCWMTLFAILAGLSKGTGLVIFIAIMAVFTIGLFRIGAIQYPLRKTVAVHGLTLLASYLALVPTLGPYLKHYRQYGSPFAINAPLDSFPYLFEKTLPGIGRAGVRSVADALFTFRFVDMLVNPLTINEGDNYPEHRTSVWSQLYGRAHFAHFDNWPRSWQLPTKKWLWATTVVQNIGRGIFILALLPTLLIFYGFVKSVVSALSSVARSRITGRGLNDWLLEIATLGYLLFIALVCLRYRDFSFMKGIYLLPGLLGFLVFFARQFDTFHSWCRETKLVGAVETVFAALLILYVADVSALIGQLTLALLS